MNDTTPLPLTPDEPAAERPRRLLRPVLIGTGAAFTVLTLGVGGFALADTMTTGSDDRIVINSSSSPSPSPSSSLIDDSSVPVTDAEYAAVTAAALAAVGGGTVIEVDRGDSVGDPAWKVEILLANGDEAEVRLDENLAVIRVELDSNGGDDSTDDDATDDNVAHDSTDDNGGTDDGTDDSGTDDSGHGSDDSGDDDSGHSGSDDSGDDDSSHSGSDDSGSDDSGHGGDD
jgi:uncharacterized membrane protein YkoI